MHLVMFDIDGTLVESYDFDSICFSKAVHDVLGISVDTDWDRYEHVSDLGILRQIIEESEDIVLSDAIINSVKQRFVLHVSEYLQTTEIKEIEGASAFIAYLQEREDVTVSFATGGWYETAQMKLSAAGIDTTGIPIASSSDHYSRTEIMNISASLAQMGQITSKTYFGDGAWDLDASRSLAYRFVLVGDRIDWQTSVENYKDIPEVLKHIGL